MKEEDIVNALSSDANEFNSLFTSHKILIATAQQYPAYAAALIMKVLASQEIFNSLMKKDVHFIKTALQFPAHADAMMQRVIAGPLEFKRLINDNQSLLHIAAYFPAYKETLITKVLADPEEFKRLVKNDFELRATAKYFPNHSVLNAKTREQALASVSEAKEQLLLIEATSSTSAQVSRDRNTLFFAPAEASRADEKANDRARKINSRK